MSDPALRLLQDRLEGLRSRIAVGHPVMVQPSLSVKVFSGIGTTPENKPFPERFAHALLMSKPENVEHPDPCHREDWVFETGVTASGFYAESAGWRRKTIEEKEMEEAMKEVDLIAPGWQE